MLTDAQSGPYDGSMIEFPPVAGGEPITISASSYVAFKNCPESANARFRGEFGPPSRPAFVGGLTHRIIARHLTSGPIASDQFEQVCREEIGSAGALNYRIADLSLKPSALKGVIEEVRGIYERVRQMPTRGFVGAEVDVEAVPAEGVTLRGRIDAVFHEADVQDAGPVRLVDWKTGRIGDPGDQLQFYALVWLLERGALPDEVEAVSIVNGERRSLVPSVTMAEAVAAELADMITSLRSAWAERREVDRRGGPWCRYCPLLDGCGEGRASIAVISSSIKT